MYDRKWLLREVLNKHVNMYFIEVYIKKYKSKQHSCVKKC